jgi:hypothetical protein
MIVAVLELLKASDDQLRDDAIAHYKAQLKAIDMKIEKEKENLELVNSQDEIIIDLKTGMIKLGDKNG